MEEGLAGGGGGVEVHRETEEQASSKVVNIKWIKMRNGGAEQRKNKK